MPRTKITPTARTTPERLAFLKRQATAIAAARFQSGFTQLTAAQALGVSEATVRSWEQARRGCPPEIRHRIVAEWGGDPVVLGSDADKCPCCGRSW
jgi:DNA-binding transcriptional regulator YiaG